MGELLAHIKSIPISDILGRYIELKKRGGYYSALCPFHPDKNPSLSVSVDKGLFKCFACGEGGDAISFVEKFSKLSFKEALIEIAGKLNLPTDELMAPKSANPKRALGLRLNKVALKIFRESAQSGKYPEYAKFITQRKLPAETVTQFALGYAPGNNAVTHYLASLPEGERGPALALAQEIGLIRPSSRNPGQFYDTFRDRVIFPIWNRYDQVVGFGSRAVFAEQRGKYVNSQESLLFNKKYLLYGLNFAKRAVREGSQLILVEGYMDCLALVSHGFSQVVAVMGVALSPAMAKDIARMAEDIVLGFDSDDAGQAAAKRAGELLLREGRLPRYLDYTPSKDPDEFLQQESRVELGERLEQAPVLLDKLIQQELSGPLPRHTDRKLAKLKRVFELVAPLGQSLQATERIVENAKQLGLKSTHQQVLDSYQQHLSQIPSLRASPPPPEEEPLLPALAASDAAAGAENPPEDSSREGSRVDYLLVENIAAHPECFKAKDYQSLLEFMSCDEVQRLAEFLRSVYFEVNEGHYPSVVQKTLGREQVSPFMMNAIAGGLLRYVPYELDGEKVDKLISDLRRKLKQVQLIEQRMELQRKSRECETDQESYQYLQKINHIQRELSRLKC